MLLIKGMVAKFDSADSILVAWYQFMLSHCHTIMTHLNTMEPLLMALLAVFYQKHLCSSGLMQQALVCPVKALFFLHISQNDHKMQTNRPPLS